MGFPRKIDEFPWYSGVFPRVFVYDRWVQSPMDGLSMTSLCFIVKSFCFWTFSFEDTPHPSGWKTGNIGLAVADSSFVGVVSELRNARNILFIPFLDRTTMKPGRIACSVGSKVCFF